MTDSSISRKVSTDAASSLIEFLDGGDVASWESFPVLSGPDRSIQHVLVARSNIAVVVVTFPANGLDDDVLVAASGEEHWVESVFDILRSHEIEEN